jgi:four helix bundle protein
VKQPYYTYAFEKLEIWQIAREFKKKIYKLTKQFPKDEIYGLTSQIKRSVGSITANIAEGSARSTDKDRAYFMTISYSSGIETLDHLITAFDQEYISEKEYTALRIEMDKLLNKINAYHTYLIERDSRLSK